MTVFPSLPPAGTDYSHDLKLVPPSPIAALTTLEAEIADLRDAIFALSDVARRSLPNGATDLHVSLQSACNELGDAERMLHAAGVAA